MKRFAFASALFASLAAAALPASAQSVNGSFTSTQSAGYVDLTRSPAVSEVIAEEASGAQTFGYSLDAALQAIGPDAGGSFTSTQSAGYADLPNSPFAGAAVIEKSIGPRQIGGSFTGGVR